MKSTDHLFAVPDVEPVEQLSPDRKRTIRNNNMIAAGIHPATKMPLAGNGEKCGTCVAAYKVNKWWKCGLVPLTFGPGTDIRKSWPACVKWEEGA